MMSIVSEITRINNNIAAAYSACEDKGATMPQAQNSANLADTIGSIPSGSTPTLQSKTVNPTTSQQSVTPDSGYDGLSDVTVNATPLEAKTITPTSQQQVVTPTAPNIGFSSVTVEGYVPPAEPEWKYVNFIDYDGTLLYSYTKEEVQALTEMPPLPVREGYTYTGWNWTLQGLKQAGRQIVGALRMTSDGSTRFIFQFCEYDNLSIDLTFQLQGGSLVVNWGDGTSDNFSTASSTYQTITANHTYANAGKHIVSMKMDGSQGDYRFYAAVFNSASRKRLTDVCIGDRVTLIGASAFQYSSMISASLPNTNHLNNVRDYAFSESNIKAFVYPKPLKDQFNNNGIKLVFYTCEALSTVSFPESMITISTQELDGCRFLKEIFIPLGVTVINGYAFRNNSSLQRVLIPNTVTSIGVQAFTSCTILSKVDLSMYSDVNNIPSLSNSNAFGSSVVFYVKNQSMLTAFEGATNWSTYAGQYQIGGEYEEATT